MSVLRIKNKIKSAPHYRADFRQNQKNLVVFCEDACDMPTLVDRMKRGSVPETKVAQYSSMICSDHAKLLDNPPVIIHDPTDVDSVDMTETHVVEKQDEETKNV